MINLSQYGTVKYKIDVTVRGSKSKQLIHHIFRGFNKGQVTRKMTSCDNDFQFPAWSDHLEGSFS